MNITLASKKIQKGYEKVTLGVASFFIGAMVTSNNVLAQDYDLPDFGFGDADENTKPDELIDIIIKYGIALVLYLLVVFMFFTVVKVTLKSYNKQRREEETKWGDIIGDVIGATLGFVFVAGIAAWFTANFLA